MITIRHGPRSPRLLSPLTEKAKGMDLFAGRTLTIVGAGRLGTALATSLTKAGAAIVGPLHHTEAISGSLVLFAVPDKEISAMAAHAPRDAIVGHTAGALTLDVLGSREAFSFHPLMSATGGRTDFRDASAAVAGSTPRALAIARTIATTLAMRPLEIPETRRAEYHAAASIAANFLVTLEAMAARLGATAGLERKDLLPLARAALENWGHLGAAALTGPIVRGDASTVARQRAAVAAVAPDLLAAWDALAAATASLAPGAK
jgi:predicted short-subunit dehydrogenase-like oxidoreductase (DUF2520 family)